MSWFSPKPQPLSPFVQEVIDLLGEKDHWELVPRGTNNAFADFTFKGPEGIVVERGSYEDYWYTVKVGDDEIKLQRHDERAIERVAWTLHRLLKQPEIERARKEREAAQRRIASALYSVLG